ncbi:xanthine dehydrogenase accessory protein XdhC [Curvibacter sp. APW13]|uniref:xanthine dehydrogenase accessory protein XdhC n=1 Tax=Curvibacter sp. APW13 TaxID=3077236 RepID=UPI0028E0246C|nr:xanthine dehydrogenase accessory protein XdhC [Curvibacter sp. APW13]MDT8991090.1 xanthine dehydrogenase accessory protein XdhC [Curvibacter sp. APW13]
MPLLDELLQTLTAEPAILVQVLGVRGSAPREVGAWMAVFKTSQMGTIGGGRLEWDALEHARRLLDGGAQGAVSVRYALGPSLGQCCGGEMTLGFRAIGAADVESLLSELKVACMPVALFGGGHVGRALVHLLGSLPVQVQWVDSRDEIFPQQLPCNVQCEHSAPVQAAVADLQPGSRVLVMSFSHAEDLDVVAACLQRQRLRGDLPFVGLIGSKSKWASFQGRLRERGYTDQDLAHVTCPIGVPGIADKRPEVIAVAVAAQLLQTLGSMAS